MRTSRSLTRTTRGAAVSRLRLPHAVHEVLISPSEGRGSPSLSAVPPNQQLDVFYRSPRQVFDAFAANGRMVQNKVRHSWGKSRSSRLAAWLASSGRLGTCATCRPISRGTPCFCRRQMAESRSSRRSRKRRDGHRDGDALPEVGGASVEIFGTWKLYTLAAADVLKVEAMYLVSGAIVPREGTSVATDQIRAQLTFRIPIIDLRLHARAAADNVSLES